MHGVRTSRWSGNGLRSAGWLTQMWVRCCVWALRELLLRLAHCLAPHARAPHPQLLTGRFTEAAKRRLSPSKAVSSCRALLRLSRTQGPCLPAVLSSVSAPEPPLLLSNLGQVFPGAALMCHHLWNLIVSCLPMSPRNQPPSPVSSGSVAALPVPVARD